MSATKDYYHEVIEEARRKAEKQTALDRQEGGNHYQAGSIQPAVYIHGNNLNFFEGNVIKYITRHRSKNGIEDLKKAIHYIEMMIELEYHETNKI